MSYLVTSRTFDDPICGKALKAQHLAKRTHELVSFLTDIMGVSEVRARYEGTVTYHDSCSGLRELGVKEQPRKLLRTVEGLTIRELPGAAKWPHKEIASFLHDQDCGDWWSQMVAVGYEQARGLRVKHQTADGFTAPDVFTTVPACVGVTVICTTTPVPGAMLPSAQTTVLPGEQLPCVVVIGPRIRPTTNSAMNTIIVTKPVQPSSRMETPHGKKNAVSRSNKIKRIATR